MKLTLFLCLILSPSLYATVIPQPQEMKLGDKAITGSLALSPKQHPLILKKLQTLPDIKLTESPETNFFISVKHPLNSFPQFKTDESYELKADSKSIHLTSTNEYGALHGLETLRQLLIDFHGKLPEIKIKDHPRFPWRGLLIDVARQWIEPATLKKQIDLMANLKFNVLHLHLSDDQAFRIESKTFSKLHQNNNDKKFYTQKIMKELIAYAADRGIRTIPEFDVPGHVSSIVAAYPELASEKEFSKPSQNFGPHDSALNPANEKTYKFLEKLFSEMSALFPDEFFHVGGDEVSGKHWLKNTEIQNYMKAHGIKDVVELQFEFTKKIEAIVLKLNKKMLAWDEVLKEGGDLGAAVQIWRGPKFANLALARNQPLIMSYGFYLDLQLSSETHYNAEPTQDLKLKNPDLLWGGEACLWSERVTDQRLTLRIWPRAMAIAERLWSAKDVTDVRDFYDRQIGLARSLNIYDTEILERIMKEAPEMNVMPEVLGEFFSWMEPGKFYSQHRYRKWNTGTVHNQWVDILPSESLKNTMFHWVFSDWLKSKSAEKLKVVNDTFSSLVSLSDQFLSMKDRDFSEKEDLMSLAKDLGSLGRIGNEALAFLNNDEKPAPLWNMEMQTKLMMMGQIRAGMQPAPFSLVQELVGLVAKKHHLTSR